ncbi:MAG: PilZ domain-containing protein [Pseudomonadota bacterium]
MTSITIGNLTVTAGADVVQFEVAGADGKTAVALDPRDAVTIERFLAEQRSVETRTGFRVPIRPLLQDLRDAFAVSLVYQGVIYDAVPVDLSLTGMLVRVPDLEVSARARLTARLLLDDSLAKLEATVVRVDGQLLALHFADAMQGGELDPPVQLGPIFSRLEQVYLRRRTRG